MKKKIKKTVVLTGCILLVLWGTAFTTDFVRCSSFQTPIFAKETSFTLNGEFTQRSYQGLGYTVDTEWYEQSTPDSCIVYSQLISVEMKVFGKCIAAAIT